MEFALLDPFRHINRSLFPKAVLPIGDPEKYICQVHCWPIIIGANTLLHLTSLGPKSSLVYPSAPVGPFQNISITRQAYTVSSRYRSSSLYLIFKLGTAGRMQHWRHAFTLGEVGGESSKEEVRAANKCRVVSLLCYLWHRFDSGGKLGCGVMSGYNGYKLYVNYAEICIATMNSPEKHTKPKICCLLLSRAGGP